MMCTHHYVATHCPDPLRLHLGQEAVPCPGPNLRRRPRHIAHERDPARCIERSTQCCATGGSRSAQAWTLGPAVPPSPAKGLNCSSRQESDGKKCRRRSSTALDAGGGLPLSRTWRDCVCARRWCSPGHRGRRNEHGVPRWVCLTDLASAPTAARGE